MPRNYKRTSTRQSWDAENMMAAIQEVVSGRMGYKRAAENYQVPQTTWRVKKTRDGGTVEEASEKDGQAAQVDVINREVTVVPGQNATFMCRVSVPLQYCRVEIPGLKTFNLNRGMSDGDVSYYGNGLDAGDCGFTINRVADNNNGQVKCTLGIQSEAQESIGTMMLTVARAPKPPELDLDRSDMQHDYKINDILHAACIVSDGRPVANLSWFLGEELVDNSELSIPTVFDVMGQENLQSKIQNLTHQLRASDNGKYLKCVAFHNAYPAGFMETKRQLDIKYPPLPQPEPIEEFGFEIGKVGVINVTIEANPKPNIEWTVNGQKIREGSVDNSGSIEAEVARELGVGKYLANLRIARITKQDTEKLYILTAYNNMGSQDYNVKISTAPEPKGWEIGIASIIGIVVAILFLILVVSILIFAKVTGRWCFSGGATVIDYTTGENGQHHHSDGISADGVDNPHHQVSSEYINGNDLPIKKDEKSDTAV